MIFKTIASDRRKATRLFSNPYAVALTAFLGFGAADAQAAEKIVFDSSRSGNYEIYIMDTDGSNVEQLTNRPGVDGFPMLSPDGQKIVFQSSRLSNPVNGASTVGIYMMDVDGSNETLLTNLDNPSFNPCYSPDGSRIVFTSYAPGAPGDLYGAFSIYTIAINGSDLQRITSPPLPNSLPTGDYNPVYSPDGQSIVFSRSFSNSEVSGGYTNLMRIPAAGGEPIELTENSTSHDYDNGACFSPDGQTIVFHSMEGGDEPGSSQQSDLYAIDADGSNRRQLTSTPETEVFAKFNPAGNKIVFSSYADITKNPDVYVMDYPPVVPSPIRAVKGTAVAASTRTNLTRDNAFDQNPFWGYAITGPATLSVTLAPSSPRTNDVLVATATTDNFAGKPNLTYVWKVDGSVKQSGSSNSFNLSQLGNGDKGQQVSVTATAVLKDRSATNTASLAVGNSSPTNASASPTSGSSAPGIARLIKSTHTDPDGGSDISEVRVLVNAALNANNTLTGRYVNGRLYLSSNNGQSFTGGFLPGSANLITNGQGSLDCARTTVTTEGNQLTINWAFIPNATFTGTKKIFGLVIDRSNTQAGWTELGSWQIASGNLAPESVSVSPNSGSSSVGTPRSFTGVYRDGNGFDDIREVRILIATGLQPASTLTGRFFGGRLYLSSNDGTFFSGGFLPGSSNVISNAQGSLDCSKTTVTGFGDTLTINWSFTPNSSFNGTKNIYGLILDKSLAQQAWKNLGNWTVVQSAQNLKANRTTPSGARS